MGKCLFVSGPLQVCNNNFLHFCVYSCYRNCYAMQSCGEGQVKKLHCMIQFANKEISYTLLGRVGYKLLSTIERYFQQEKINKKICIPKWPCNALFIL